ncbi:hypothetical protein ACQP25_17110 [Microtetraspora malaysiensis]|uniref:hypothetical protein n=1 Tax=Microtetraspora malaysiensis TaxID=161358 RepID=UPI003D93897C
MKHSQRPAPLSATALLSFHDAVENFLGLAADHLQVKVNSKINFMEYWGRIKDETDLDLPGKTSMNRLNDARVGLKHHGNFPSPQTIEQSRDAVRNFFTGATRMVFSADFDTIDMVDLVTQAKIAQLLREAQTHADIGDYIQAMAGLYLALEALLDHYAHGPGTHSWYSSRFSFGPALRNSMFDSLHYGRDGIEQRLTDLSSVAREIQEAMRVVALGIDFPSYVRFQVLAPTVHGYMNGSYRYSVTKSVESLTADDYSWARNFVIEAALNAATADEVLELGSAQIEANWNPEQPPEERAWTGPAKSD